MSDDQQPYLDWREDPHGSPPADLVPHTDQRTAQHYRDLNDRVGSLVETTTPGEPIEDVDGQIVGMTPSRTERAIVGPAIVDRADLEAVGLRPEDVPNLKVRDFQTMTRRFDD